jgi:hypothetical protein
VFWRRRPKTNKELGRIGEEHAARFLASRGYKIRERNFRLGRGAEADIVAEHKGALVFVEVKSRTADDEFPPRLVSVEGAPSHPRRRRLPSHLRAPRARHALRYRRGLSDARGPSAEDRASIRGDNHWRRSQRNARERRRGGWQPSPLLSAYPVPVVSVTARSGGAR